MVDFDRLNYLSHTTSMLSVLEYYDIDYQNSAPDRYKSLCPFHDDNTPSLIVYIKEKHEEESFCCYACNEAGDAFHFIRQMEGGDFQQGWTILCHINGVEDDEANTVDQLNDLLRMRQGKQDTRSVNAISSQVSVMYRKLYQSFQTKLSSDDQSELAMFIDKRFKHLDTYLHSNPSYADLHQYFKHELTHLKQLRQHFK